MINKDKPMVKVDLIVVGAIINEAIASIEDKYEWNNKFLILDGIQPDSGYGEQFLNYRSDVEYNNPSFNFRVMDKCIYFKEILMTTLGRSDADYVVVIQDDVLAPQNIDLDEDLEFMRDNSDCKIISYPHKIIPEEGTHWFVPIETKGKYIKTHGWSERVFLAKRKDFYHNIRCERGRGKKAEKFCEYVYHNTLKRLQSKGELPSEEYWKAWGIYIKNDNIHSHLVAHRPKGHSHTTDFKK